MSELLTCVQCGAAFERPAATGRKPKTCSKSCHGRYAVLIRFGRRDGEPALTKAERAARERAARAERHTVITDRECEACGIGFAAPATSRRKFCEAHLHPSTRVVARACRFCGKAFQAKSSRAEVCYADECQRAKHAERNRKFQADYRAKHGKTYAHVNYPAERKAHAAVRRARRKDATVEPFTPEDLLASWIERELYRCAYCDGPYEHTDHVIPLARGGAHSIGNLVPACAACNLAKGTKTPEEFIT